MSIPTSAAAWAEETFRDVHLGDSRRTKRLVSIAASLARAPAGAVMASVQTAAEREGAFRFLASENFSVGDLTMGITAATLRKCSGITYCPVDGASITVADRAHSRDVGGVGTWEKGARGLQAVTALAADVSGAPVGILGAEWWARTQRSLVDPACRRPELAGQSELRHSLAAVRRIELVRQAVASNAQLWFQFDRGFDAWPVFKLAYHLGLLLTVRSSTDRRVVTKEGRGYLNGTVMKAPVVGSYRLDIPERPDRPAREAMLSVRIARLKIVLQVGSGRTETVPVSVVSAHEETNSSHDRLRWVLLTTAAIYDFAAARRVIEGYTTRWLIEDLHRAWKRGWTNVEKTQLRRRNSLCKWATLHLALASRALRLARLARTEPTKPAAEAFSRLELDAILLMKKGTTPYSVGATPTLKEAVLLLAEIGGYDRYSPKPPGPTVIGRGLERIGPLAYGLAALRDEK